MKPLRAFSLHELVVLWAAGLALAVGLFLAFAHVEWSLLRPGLTATARENAVARARDAQAAAIQDAYARAHPTDSAAQLEARRLAAAAEQSAKADSALDILVSRGRVDTTLDAANKTARPAFTQLLMLLSSLAMFGAALAIPILLIVITVWWAMVRRAAGREAPSG
jgi:hypothetical protein